MAITSFLSIIFITINYLNQSANESDDSFYFRSIDMIKSIVIGLVELDDNIILSTIFISINYLNKSVHKLDSTFYF